jgi:hypothetical protein
MSAEPAASRRCGVCMTLYLCRDSRYVQYTTMLNWFYLHAIELLLVPIGSSVLPTWSPFR